MIAITFDRSSPVRHGRRMCRKAGMTLALLLFVMPLVARAGDLPPVSTLPARAPEGQGASPSVYRFPDMGNVALFKPEGPPKAVIISFSGTDGWSERDTRIARHLAASGALVAGISTPAFVKALVAGKGCINPNYDVADLSRDIQHREKLRTYMKPALFGRGEGGAIAYATLASGPAGIYRAVISMEFTPTLPFAARWCSSAVLKAAGTGRRKRAVKLVPAGPLSSPWIVISPSAAALPTRVALRNFVSNTGNGRLIEAGDPMAVAMAQVAPFLTQPLPAVPPQHVVPLPNDLPLTIVGDPAAPRTDMMAILYSGDGGWAGLDRDIASALAGAGVPVVGLDSLSYFWSERNPSGAAADLDALILGYSRHWNRPKVLLIGYSFGADAMPYIVERLSPAAREHVVKLALLGLSPTAEFQFHLSSWLNIGSSDSYPTIPAIARLRGLPMLCIEGAEETGSACRAIPKGIARTLIVPGGHHFDDNAPLLARAILSGIPH